MALDMTKVRQRFKELQNERNPFDHRYRELAKYILPDSGRFEVTENALEVDRWKAVYDPTASDAVDVLSAGMLSGMTSPARPWFKLTTGNRKLDNRSDIKRWLAELTEEMQRVFLASNVYQALIQCYQELPVFGTACMVALPSADNIIHLHVLTVGEYWIAENAEQQVNTLYRRFTMTAEQLVSEFGREACSTQVQNAYDNNKRFDRFSVIHAIEPREDYIEGSRFGKAKRFRSVYFEEKVDDGTKNKYLLEEGFDTFPGLCPRWNIHGGCVYGTSPGMKALRQIKALQVEALRKAQGIDQQTNPAMMYPASMENHQIDFAPGGVSFYADGTTPQQAYPAVVANVNLQHLMLDIQDTRKQINSFFYKDLFTLIMSTPRTNRTAFEVDQMVQERMGLLGPVLQRLNMELLRPLIAMALTCMDRAGRIPPPPADVEGLDVTFESILMQALRSAGITATDRYVAAIINVSNVKSDILDKIDFDAYADDMADKYGVDPKINRTDEDVEAIRSGRAQAQAQQSQMAQMAQMTDVAKTMTELNPDLTQAGGIDALQGY